MTATVFVLAFLTSMAAYAVISGRLARQERAASLSRLAGKTSPRKPGHKSQPALFEIVDDVRGRLAARLIDRLHLKQSLEQLLDTADLKWGAIGLAHRCAGFFLAGFAAATLPTGNRYPLFGLGAAIVAGALPFLYVRRRANKRVRQFEEQFPDCLEFVARSMKAGHAFSMSLEMVYREFSEPLAAEFRRTFEEQKLGQPLDIVLNKLARRIPSMDVQFFTSAVLLQKRTGGNLAELLEKLAHIIRERFKLRARVRAISAQGLMSGSILAAIPAGVGTLMFVVNPTYARFFVDDPMGHKLLGASIALQCVGYLIIRKIVTIEV